MPFYLIFDFFSQWSYPDNMLAMFRESWWLESQSGGLCGLLVVELPFFALSMYPFYSRYFSLIFSERIWRLGAPPPKQQLPDHVWKGLLSDPFSFILNGSLSFSNGLVFEGLRRKIGMAMTIFTFITNLSQLCVVYFCFGFFFVLFALLCLFVVGLCLFAFLFLQARTQQVYNWILVYPRIGK